MTINDIKSLIDYAAFVLFTRVIILYCINELWKFIRIAIGMKLGILKEKR